MKHLVGGVLNGTRSVIRRHRSVGKEQRAKCSPIDDTFTNKMCQSESDHEWKFIGLFTVGVNYRCRKCGIRKTISWEENLG